MLFAAYGPSVHTGLPMPPAIFLAMMVATAKAPPWTAAIYPETLTIEATRLQNYPDIARRDGAVLTILDHGRTLRRFKSRTSACQNRNCPAWLFQGAVDIGSQKLAVVRQETGHGGHDAIVRADGSLLWTEGFPVVSPDGRWLAVSGDVTDEMEDISSHEYLRLFAWKTSFKPIGFHRSCIVRRWISSTQVTVYCLGSDHDDTLSQDAKGRWRLAP